MIKQYFIACLLTIGGLEMQAQYCNNPTDTVYGLTASGRIVPINVNTATAGVARDSTSTGINANGLGFSSMNGSFYFFNRCNTLGAPDLIQFVRYIPSTRTTIVLADPPASFTATTKSRSGCMNTAGDGYYTINPGAAGGPALYYYTVGTGLWTTITQTFKNSSGTSVADIVTLNSGDMAFDGSGNLWMICSGSGKYALYEIKGPVPTTVIASVLVDTIISERATPTGDNFTGISFNATGKLYLSTGAGVNPGNNNLYELATTTGTVTLIGTLPAGYGDDLTSCSFPKGVLAVVWVNFTAELNNNSVKLSWKVNEENSVTGYDIESSQDKEHWQVIGRVAKEYFSPGSLKCYNYIVNDNTSGNDYYRIIQLSSSGTKNISSTKRVAAHADAIIYIGPNPAKDVINFYNKDNTSKLLTQVFDQSGKLMWSTIVPPGQQSINISDLPKGNYLLKLLSTDGNTNVGCYQFIKW